MRHCTLLWVTGNVYAVMRRLLEGRAEDAGIRAKLTTEPAPYTSDDMNHPTVISSVSNVFQFPAHSNKTSRHTRSAKTGSLHRITKFDREHLLLYILCSVIILNEAGAGRSLKVMISLRCFSSDEVHSGLLTEGSILCIPRTHLQARYVFQRRYAAWMHNSSGRVRHAVLLYNTVQHYL
ncbi:hypothetical protein HBH70_138930 [Parastagonospora nodorum]|nr:hypothetical protein HBH52_155630 [Parastagonospora nodorum]KAH3996576.1 hypothetical protein HBI10_154730 [Parastagonospora nodorum]KAH4019170.1 hypothetical protein HBI13_131350 [Parastagonospora nodorum]KAH4070722.1 hypothetical protein HBH50_087580 [Parastagonospora nodorum]KAH4093011.1 hypothetical protein HBH48_075760 [Parastagonospora nodorum]